MLYRNNDGYLEITFDGTTWARIVDLHMTGDSGDGGASGTVPAPAAGDAAAAKFLMADGTWKPIPDTVARLSVIGSADEVQLVVQNTDWDTVHNIQEWRDGDGLTVLGVAIGGEIITPSYTLAPYPGSGLGPALYGHNSFDGDASGFLLYGLFIAPSQYLNGHTVQAASMHTVDIEPGSVFADGGALTATERAGLAIGNHGGSAIGTAYGLKLADQTGATVANYALYTGKGDVRIGDSTIKLGFFGKTPVARVVAYTLTYSTKSRTNANLTAATVATTAATQAAPWGYSTQAQADALVTQLNALVADVLNIKQVLTQVIDDLKSYGLLQ